MVPKLEPYQCRHAGDSQYRNDPVNDLHIVEWLLCSGRYKEIRCVGCVCKPTREFLRCVVRGEKRSNTRWIVDLSNK